MDLHSHVTTIFVAKFGGAYFVSGPESPTQAYLASSTELSSSLFGTFARAELVFVQL